MGDLCESIVALNMRQFSTRDARIRSFIKGLFGQGDQIAPATGEGFARWKEAKRAQVTGSILRNIDKLSSELADGCKESLIAEEIESDLDNERYVENEEEERVRRGSRKRCFIEFPFTPSRLAITVVAERRSTRAPSSRKKRPTRRRVFRLLN